MRKVKESYMKYFPALRLIRQDFVDILSVLQGHFPETEIIVGEFCLDNIAEIDNISGSYVNTCKIMARDNKDFLHFEMKPNIISIFLSDGEDPKMLGIVQKIGNILNRRKDFRRFTKTLTFQVILSFLVNTAAMLSWQLIDGHIIFKIILTIIAIILLANFFIYTNRSHSRLYLSSSASPLGFWAGNQERIYGAIIAGITVWAITQILSALLK